jgi:hypothetical protein
MQTEFGLLLPQHVSLLRASGISPAVATTRGYVSVESAAELKRRGFAPVQQRTPGLLIPIWDVTGHVPLYQLRPDTPRIDEHGRPIKYETPAHGRPAIDVHPMIHEHVRDPNIPLWITEGSRKADAAISRGLCCIALLGVWSWIGTNEKGGRTALPDWREIALNRQVRVVFDSDVMLKSEVHRALSEFSEFLKLHRAAVSFAYLPRNNGAKVGLDDFLVNHSLDELHVFLTPTLQDDPAAPARLTFTALGTLLSEPNEATSWVWDGIAPVGGLSGVGARPKVGKSTLVRCLALAVARGGRFLGRTTTQGTVLYLALEEKRAEVRAHFHALGAMEADPIRVFIAPSPANGLAQLHSAALEIRPRLIIIDPIIRMVRLKDANAYAEVMAALEPVLAVARDSGAHVTFTHHSGREDRKGDAFLGSVGFQGTVDTGIFLKRGEHYRTLYTEQRYGEDLEEVTLTLDPVTRWVSLGPSKFDADAALMEREVVDFLAQQKEPAGRAAVRDGVTGRTQDQVRALTALIRKGYVIRTGLGTKHNPHLFALANGVQGTREPLSHWEPVPSPINGEPREPQSTVQKVVPTGGLHPGTTFSSVPASESREPPFPPSPESGSRSQEYVHASEGTGNDFDMLVAKAQELFGGVIVYNGPRLSDTAHAFLCGGPGQPPAKPANRRENSTNEKTT